MSIKTAEIIQFAAIRPKLGKRTFQRSELVVRPLLNEEGTTDTAGNLRLRKSRLDVWREADSVMDYWRMSMKMDGVISRVQHCGAPEGELHPIRDPKDYWTLVTKWREAWVRLMLTPAPDMRSVTWKRAQLKARYHKHTDLKPALIERAIAEDVEFLRSHPTRRGGHYSPKRDQEQ
jgi:hypothetical protein